MPVSDVRPFISFLTGGTAKPQQPPRKPRPETEDEMRARVTRDYLVGLSRKSARGQEYARNADSVRSMIRDLGTTKDFSRRRAIVQTLKNKGWIDE